MQTFPDEASLPKSDISGDPIRGGSIGLNKVLGRFVERAGNDRAPEFTGALLSAFTFFRNVYTMNPNADIRQMGIDFARDVNLFLEYYDAYLSFTKGNAQRQRYSPVVMYYPDYHHVDTSLFRTMEGRRGAIFAKYKEFLSHYNGKDQIMRRLENCFCSWVSARNATYPHIDAVRKFKDIGSSTNSLYSPGDTVALMTHIPLDYHAAKRLRGVALLQSYTGKLVGSDSFKLQLDDQGRVPFNTTTHLAFGDSELIKPWVTPKAKKMILEQAEKERWISRSESDIQSRIAKITEIPVAQFRKYDFV